MNHRNNRSLSATIMTDRRPAENPRDRTDRGDRYPCIKF
jgi:hypothetical protein